jgi:hypothetical protein
VSVRFDAVLGETERAELLTALSSDGAVLASWNPHSGAGATYARLAYAHGSPAETLRARFPTARVDDPPLVVLEVEAFEPAVRERVHEALGGPARPAGILRATPAGSGIVVELDASRTPLSLVVDLIDAEAGGPGRRRIRPLLGLTDAQVAAFVGSVLMTPDLDASRFIETYAEPLLRGERPSCC